MKTESGIVCNGCRTDLPINHPVSSFTVRATGHQLPPLHLCEECKPKYEAKAGLKLRDFSEDGKEINPAG